VSLVGNLFYICVEFKCFVLAFYVSERVPVVAVLFNVAILPVSVGSHHPVIIPHFITSQFYTHMYKSTCNNRESCVFRVPGDVTTVDSDHVTYVSCRSDRRANRLVG
jgi:hypothetical protein